MPADGCHHPGDPAGHRRRHVLQRREQAVCRRCRHRGIALDLSGRPAVSGASAAARRTPTVASTRTGTRCMFVRSTPRPASRCSRSAARGGSSWPMKSSSSSTRTRTPRATGCRRRRPISTARCTRPRGVRSPYSRRTGGGDRRPDGRGQVGVQHRSPDAGRRWVGDRERHLDRRPARRRRDMDAAGHRRRARACSTSTPEIRRPTTRGPRDTGSTCSPTRSSRCVSIRENWPGTTRRFITISGTGTW